MAEVRWRYVLTETRPFAKNCHKCKKQLGKEMVLKETKSDCFTDDYIVKFLHHGCMYLEPDE